MYKTLRTLIEALGGRFRFVEPPVLDYHGRKYTVYELHISVTTNSVGVRTDKFSDLLCMIAEEFNEMLYYATIGILRDAAGVDRNLF